MSSPSDSKSSCWSRLATSSADSKSIAAIYMDLSTARLLRRELSETFPRCGIKRIRWRHLLQQRSRIVNAALTEPRHREKESRGRPIGLQSDANLQRCRGEVEFPGEQPDQPEVALGARVVLLQASSRFELRAYSPEGGLNGRRGGAAAADNQGDQCRNPHRASRVVKSGVDGPPAGVAVHGQPSQARDRRRTDSCVIGSGSRKERSQCSYVRIVAQVTDGVGLDERALSFVGSDRD